MILLFSRLPLTLYLAFSASVRLFQPAVDAAKDSIGTTFPTSALCRSPIPVAVNTTSILDVGRTGLQQDFTSLDADTTISATSGVAVVDIVDFGFMDHQRSVLEQPLLTSRDPLSLKAAEIAFRSLSTFAMVTNVTVDNGLIQFLDKFAVDAKTTSQGLQRLFSKLHGVIDDIIGFTEFAAPKLKTPASLRSLDVYDPVVARTFQYSTNTLSSEVARVLLEITAVIENFDILDEQLAAIYSVSEQERVATSVGHSWLSEWWTYLGRNHGQRLDVLDKVNRYRAVAVGRVGVLSHFLTAIEADLVELLERLKAPASVHGLPSEVHFASINTGAHRLKERVSVDHKWETISG
uniref:Protein kinase domain-containing protein n=1 Tax=Ganoderma boninense TaxID=34458 RepID=A0A5K1K7P7_9APHY|nr:Protein kinase domain-containing protein [Ganoderma boninense]